MDEELLNWLRIQIYTARHFATEALKHWPPGDEIAGQVESIEAGAFIHRNNPHAVLAQCEAHTALLKEHVHVEIGFVGPGMESFGCEVCSTGHDGQPQGLGWCATVRAVALAYQYNEGYQEEWRP